MSKFENFQRNVVREIPFMRYLVSYLESYLFSKLTWLFPKYYKMAGLIDKINFTKLLKLEINYFFLVTYTKNTLY